MYTDKLLDIRGNNILIIGNWSYKNLGDELILIGTIKLLQDQGKNIFIQVYNPNWLKGFLEQFVDISDITFLTEIPKGIRSWIRYLWKQQWRELVSYPKISSVIVGGGEILTEENPHSYWYWLISLLPILIKKVFFTTNIYLMGGIQIPKKNLNKILFDFLLSKTTCIYARDFDTVKALNTYGYRCVEFFMDTAYYAFDWKKLATNKHSGSQKKYIIINLNKNGEHFLQDIINDIKNYIEQGYHIYYCPMSKGKNAEYNDEKYYKILKDKLDSGPNHCGSKAFGGQSRNDIEILDWEHDFSLFAKVVQGAEIVISTRLHLFLVASFLGVKTKVYPYQRKILKMEDMLRKIDII